MFSPLVFSPFPSCSVKPVPLRRWSFSVKDDSTGGAVGLPDSSKGWASALDAQGFADTFPEGIPIPIQSMYGIFTYIYLIFMVNVGKYTIHGSYGIGSHVSPFPVDGWFRNPKANHRLDGGINPVT